MREAPDCRAREGCNLITNMLFQFFRRIDQNNPKVLSNGGQMTYFLSSLQHQEPA
jgi:hypothetical protein